MWRVHHTLVFYWLYRESTPANNQHSFYPSVGSPLGTWEFLILYWKRKLLGYRCSVADDHKCLMNYKTGCTTLRMSVISLVVRVGFNVGTPHNEICRLYSKIDPNRHHNMTFCRWPPSPSPLPCIWIGREVITRCRKSLRMALVCS